MRILLIEDEPDAANMLAKGLREHAYAVDVLPDGQDAAFRVKTTDYDAVILDVMLPGQDGFAVCREVRAAGAEVPVLMLTARDAIESRITGLDSGADDYLTKPFDFGELLARLRAVIRRGVRPPLTEALQIGSIRIDTRTHRVTKDEQAVRLTTREYALLEFLARRAGAVVGRAEIAEHVWDDSYDPMSNVIDVYIQRLRRKLDTKGTESVIATHRGAGYSIVSPVVSSGFGERD